MGADDMLAGTEPGAFSPQGPDQPGWLNPPPVPPTFGVALAALLEAVGAGGFYDDYDRAAALLDAARQEWEAIVEDLHRAEGVEERESAAIAELGGARIDAFAGAYFEGEPLLHQREWIHYFLELVDTVQSIGAVGGKTHFWSAVEAWLDGNEGKGLGRGPGDNRTDPAVLVDLDGRVSVDPLQVSGLEKWADQVTIVHLMGTTIRVDRPIDVIRRVLRGHD